MSTPRQVTIREVGPRDGLQAEAPVPVEARVALIEGLLAAGVRHVEVASFVSPKAVPAMAGAAEVVAAVGRPEGVVRTALVPNVRGAELALDAGVDELTVTVSASETYSQKNVHMSTEESLAATEGICALASAAGVPVDAVLSFAFGSPYEGDLPPEDLTVLASRLVGGGATTITLADTTGMATPRRVDEALEALAGGEATDDAAGDVLVFGGGPVGLHLHETRGTGLLNLYAGFQRGIRRFDTSVGGLGGSPFAAGAGGNVATEDAVALLDDLGVATGIDLDRLLVVSADLERTIGRPVPSRVAHAGPRTRRAGG
jgi:hydroxymethylglutaryl-CoA lyase